MAARAVNSATALLASAERLRSSDAPRRRQTRARCNPTCGIMPRRGRASRLPRVTIVLGVNNFNAPNPMIIKYGVSRRKEKEGKDGERKADGGRGEEIPLIAFVRAASSLSTLCWITIDPRFDSMQEISLRIRALYVPNRE